MKNEATMHKAGRNNWVVTVNASNGMRMEERGRPIWEARSILRRYRIEDIIEDVLHPDILWNLSGYSQELENDGVRGRHVEIPAHHTRTGVPFTFRLP